MNAQLLDHENMNDDEISELDDEGERWPGASSIANASRIPVDLAGPRMAERGTSIAGGITADESSPSASTRPVPSAIATANDSRPSITEPSIAGGQPQSITGMSAPAAPISASARPSIAGLIESQPGTSLTGMAPMGETPMPETLPDIPGAAPLDQVNIPHPTMRPQWKDYRPSQVGVGRKILAASIGGLIGMGGDANEARNAVRSILAPSKFRQFNDDTNEFNALNEQDKMDQNAEDFRAKERTDESEDALRDAQIRNIDSETNMRNKPPAKEGLSPDDQTFDDLMHGNNGKPQINPDTGKPYTSLEANRAVKQIGQTDKRFTDPFQAFAYGTPAEKKSAQDFISFQKQTDARYQRPDEIEARYQLYKRDPEAYKEMFGNRDAAQDSKDQAQAARMLKYFDGQRKSIQNDFTLSDEEKQQQLGQIDQLEQPYLDIAQPQANTAGNSRQRGGRGASGNAPQYKAGDSVTYKGQQMRVSKVRPDGKLELEPITQGAQ